MLPARPQPVRLRDIMPPVADLHYYPVQRRWRKIKPHLQNPKVQCILVRDMHKFTWGRWKQEFKPGMLPEEVESCDWRCSHPEPHPHFWRYVKHSACHWLVNFNMTLAQLVEPKKNWRIITSDKHSTTWDGANTLFDFNFLALGVPMSEAYELVVTNGMALPVGKKLRTYYPPHYTECEN